MRKKIKQKIDNNGIDQINFNISILNKDGFISIDKVENAIKQTKTFLFKNDIWVNSDYYHNDNLYYLFLAVDEDSRKSVIKHLMDSRVTTGKFYNSTGWHFAVTIDDPLSNYILAGKNGIFERQSATFANKKEISFVPIDIKKKTIDDFKKTLQTKINILRLIDKFKESIFLKDISMYFNFKQQIIEEVYKIANRKVPIKFKGVINIYQDGSYNFYLLAGSRSKFLGHRYFIDNKNNRNLTKFEYDFFKKYTFSIKTKINYIDNASNVLKAKYYKPNYEYVNKLIQKLKELNKHTIEYTMGIV